MFCKNCGSSLPEDSKFCPACGTIAEPAVQPRPVAQPQVSPAAVPAPQAKSNTVLVAILTALVTVVVVVLLMAVLFMTTGDREETTSRGDGQSVSWQESIGMPTEPSETEPALDPANAYYDVFVQYKDYVFRDSDSRYLSRGDFKGLSEKAVFVAQQEIYARHGETFSDGDLQAYFEARDWYSAGSGSFDPSSQESANLKLFEVHFALQDGTEYAFNNPYFEIDKNPDGHMLPASSTRHLRAADVKHMSLEQLQLARNEIFARNGYLFGDEDLLEFFLSKNWYRPTTTKDAFSSSVFSSTENANIDFIRLYENRIKGVSISSGNPFKPYYSPYRDYIIYDSSSRQLREYELSGYDANELSLARNEIFARHGYYFGDQDLLEYFMQFDWYQPDTPKGDSSGISFSKVENSNIELLRELQNNYGKAPGTDDPVNYAISNN